MNFIENILRQLQRAGDRAVIQQAGHGRLEATSGNALLAMVTTARAFFRRHKLTPGDRLSIIGGNSARWCALDLAALAEGLICVPLYHRQPPEELRAALEDCAAAMVCCATKEDAAALRAAWPDAPPCHTFDTAFDDRAARDITTETANLANEDPLTIIYTSGTSGRSKGVVLTRGNLEHILPCTRQRLDELLAGVRGEQRIFHYLPCCFAGSRILMLTALGRDNVLTFSTDLEQLVQEMRLARPHIFLNVPALLERVRRGVEAHFGQGSGPMSRAFRAARDHWLAQSADGPPSPGGCWAWIGCRVVFPAIRRRIGADLVGLICGSAPLSEDTQRFFQMIGLPVLQVYGLTETTAICTMDHADDVVPGRVGRAIPGIEMTLGDDNEILVRGPHIFAGYWNRPQETAAVMRDEWFRTGDQGEVNACGNWRIMGRLKNMIILDSGHNIVPDPLEDQLLNVVPGAEHVLLVGNRRSHLAAIVTGSVTSNDVEAGLLTVNENLPHYKRIHRYCVHGEPFSQENGMLTANGKLRRDAITKQLEPQIEALYEKTSS